MREMTKSEWFLNAIRAGAYKKKHWLIRCFSMVRANQLRLRDVLPWDIMYVDGGAYPEDVIFLDEDKEEVRITDWKYNQKDPQPPFRVREGVDLKAGDVVNLSTDVRTTYGNVIANALALIFPFGDLLEFRTGRFSLKDIEKDIERLLTSNPENGEYQEGVMYVRDYMKFTKAAGMIAGLSQLCVPSATRKSMSAPPGIAKLKKELLEKYKDDLTNPLIVAKIESALIDYTNEYLEGDRSEGFLIGGKSRRVVNKKAYNMMGLISAFSEDTEPTLVTRSLEEGMELEDLPALASDIREGSYDRGAETALGGDEVKKMLGITQNTVVEEDDCKTEQTFPFTVFKEHYPLLEGMYIQEKGVLVEITSETVSQYLGKTIPLRTPYYCKNGKSNVCKVCIGKKYAQRPTSLPSGVSGVGSYFMGVFMASMHAKELNTTKFIPELHIF